MKGYWIAKVNVLHPDKQKMYAELASKAVQKYDGKFLVRGGSQVIAEGKEYERNVVVAYSSFDNAKKAYNSKEYQEAKKLLGEDKDRLFAIVEGYE